MKKWMRPVLMAIVLMVLLLPAVSEKADAETIYVSTLEELREAVKTPNSTVQVQADISCSDERIAEIEADYVVLDLNGHTLTSSAENYDMFCISRGHVKICNGTLVGTNKNVYGFYIRGTTKQVQLEDLTVKNTANLVAIGSSFEHLYMNHISYIQNKNVYDGTAISVGFSGKAILNDVTMECWNSTGIAISHGAVVHMGKVSIEKMDSGSWPLLSERNPDKPRIYYDYLVPTASLKIDGTTVNVKDTLQEGGSDYYIEGTKLESTVTSTLPINTMTLELEEPEPGETPDYRPEIGNVAAYLDITNGFFVNDIVWSDITENSYGTHMNPEDVFQRGRTYEATIYVTPEAGYRFTDETEVTVNGETVKSTNRTDLNQIAVSYTYTTPPEEEEEEYYYTVDMTAGSVQLTGYDAYAFTEAGVEALEKEGQIYKEGDYSRFILDLDKDGKWDVLVNRDHAETLNDKYTVYKLPSCSVTGDLAFSMSEEMAHEMEVQGYSSKVKYVFTDAVKARYQIVNVADQTYTGKALKPAPKVRLVSGKRALTLKKGTDYTLSYKNNVNVGTATITVKGKGLPLGTLKKTFKIVPVNLAASTTKTSVSGIKASYAYTGKAIKPTPTVKALVGGAKKTLKAGTDYTVKYTNNVKPGTATVTITGKGNFKGTVKKTFKIKAAPKPGYDRLAGADRYATSREIAAAYKKALGVSKFDAVCVADGQNYPDALAGAYFAAQKKAPILVVHQAAPTGDKSMATINYIKANLKAGGTVYILGGPGSVPDVVLNTLTNEGFKVQRLWGQNRYGSNLAILKAAKVKAGTDFIVCTGAQFADALSASATGKPVLLVAGNKLTEDQKAYLKGVKAKSFTIVGTVKDVAPAIETELKTYAPVTRLNGADIYTRSIQIAKKFFPATVSHINLADGRNFPDALCGGPLAQKLSGPLLLTDGSAAVNEKMKTYASGAKTIKATVFGGPASVTDATVKYILSMN